MVGRGERVRAGGVEIAEPEIEERTSHVPLYKVLLHNDDETPMDFVLEILRGVFSKEATTAWKIMMEAHDTGIALVEIVPYEHAELHVDKTRSLARARQHPLTLSIEPADGSVRGPFRVTPRP